MQEAVGAEAHVTIHASGVVFREAGVLIRGRSGAGKSSLAMSLLTVGSQAGCFVRLVGDDRIELSRHGGRLVARGHAAIQGLIELRGQGIVRVAYEPAVVLRLVVDLLPAEELARYPSAADLNIEVCGVKLQRLALPSIRSSYDWAFLIMAHLQQDGII